MTAGPVLAAGDLAALPLAIGLVGGLAVFLLGMELMTDALKLVAGDSMKRVLARLTTNRLRAAMTGVFVTAVIQSSSVTTVLVVGFVSSGLLTLTQAIGIIMGANVGTTITAQIIAFKVTGQALVLVAFGFGASVFAGRPRLAQGGRAVMGLGLIFLGMNLMAEATSPLRENAGFIAVLGHLDHPVAALLVGALFTALIQASAATTGIVIILAGQGLVGLETGIALILGANVGTCITAFFASLKAGPDARRAALAHILFNVLGAALWLPLVPLLADLVIAISPMRPDLGGGERIAAEIPRRIANAHAVFNVANLLVFIGLTGPLARLLTRLVPAAPAPERIEPRFLDPLLLATPALALARVRLELAHLARVVREFAASFPRAVGRGPDAVRELSERDDDVDRLHSAVVGYLARLSAAELSAREAELVGCYMAAANYLEQIGDTLATNGVSVAGTLAAHRREIEQVEPPEPFRRLSDLVSRALAELLRQLDDDEVDAGREIVRMKSEVVAAMRKAGEDLLLRLRIGGEAMIPIYRAESDFLDLQRRVFYLTRRVAKTLLEAHRVAGGDTKAPEAPGP